MARQLGVEGLEHLERLVLLAVARQPGAVGFDQAERRGVELLGAVETLAGLFLVARQIEDQAGVQILEQRVPVGALQLVDRLDGGLGIARAVACPGGQQRGGEIGDRPANGLGEVLLGERVFLLLERVDADHQPGDAVVLVELDDLVGEPDRLLDVALRQHRQEGALQKLGDSSGRHGAKRGNRRRRRRRRDGCRRGGRRGSFPKRSGATAHAPTANRWKSARCRARLPGRPSEAGKSKA